MIAAIYIIATMLLYAWADRFAGGGLGWKSTYRGRPVWYAGVVVLLASSLFIKGGWIVPLAWLVWRLPAWGFLGGSITPSTPTQIGSTFARHGLILLLVPLAWLGGMNATVALICAVLFMLWATLLGWLNGSYARSGHDINGSMEIFRGAGFGIAGLTAVVVR